MVIAVTQKGERMDDVISRQAAIDALMAWEEDSIWDEECLKHRGEPFWVAPSDVVEQLPSAQPEQRWIPCSERLPEHDGEAYLVTDYCESINRKRIHVSYCYMNREGFWSDVPIGYKVLAWMPLPEPWIGEEDDRA